ncbi:hypothetical protein CHLRE_16g680350v5 [Chlamydomonas reinhardtii]|uniref:Uncharacterized protein n=1 Tax=Chlamydomonas reinhardtii TaxID=3055 RepID=A0A2K3CV44_CHLRE|nr:uncharacterized protein CHLRE_16g680350v5 [Chlamydomonas reinhardtii]PNW72151.1 hypothetical protein CHLRE_16g680350v5 [Chlamydomonas reinhardtii]
MVRTSCSASAEDASLPARLGLHTSVFGKPEVDMIIFLAQNNVDHGLILDYLQAKESNSTTQLNTEMVQLQGELNTERQRGEKEVVRLQGELNLERERGDKEVVRLKGELQLMTAQYLQLKGKLDMRGLMEYIQDTMSVRTGVNWEKTNPVSSWRSYISVRPRLKQCLEEHYVNTDEAPQALSDMCTTLSIAFDNSRTPDEYYQMGLKLHIGTPLKDGQQRALMTCLCKDLNVPYEYV